VQGDCLATLRTLPAASHQCCVTSPPYYGLRDYGHAGQIGLEPTPEQYIARMVEVFREVRRVLRDDGTLWLNLGDSYASVEKGSGGTNSFQAQNAGFLYGRRKVGMGAAKPKDLLMIPAQVALALRADGWFLRADIIWHKPNPMPESVRDRPTSAHEHVFLLTKSARYFYDADAIKEAPSEGSADAYRAALENPRADREYQHDSGSRMGKRSANRAWADPETLKRMLEGRNARNVWTIATQPYSGAHFATMPPDLAERCIKAGSSEKGQCPHCGSPWARVTEKGQVSREWQRRCGGDENGEYHGQSTKGHAAAGVQDASAVKARILAGMAPTVTTGWAPSCACPAHQPVQQRILDPFGGAGTTGLVADRLNRSATLCELNPEYARLARERITADAPLLAGVA
jgi:DNA modification methylase